MASDDSATWTKNGKFITGRWKYVWASDRFYICLDKKDPVTGMPREFYTSGDHPEFNGWKLVREEK